ncbi:MAG: hypothetical protein AAGF11_05920 [Myxococcota bacterium]
MTEPLDMSALLAVMDSQGQELERDPLFSGAEIEVLHGYLGGSSGDPEDLFGETLQGMSEAYRYGALWLVARAWPAQRACEFGDPLEDEEVRYLAGNVRVAGNLRLPDNAIVVVTGDLEITGNLVEDRAYYSMVGVGGRLSAKNVLVSGELLAREVVLSEDYITYGNDYSSRIGRLQARRYLSEEHFDHILAKEVEREVRGRPLPGAQELLPAKVLDYDSGESDPYPAWERLQRLLLGAA